MGRYDDIINLPHHVSPYRKRMDNIERAAQFSPFAALTGYSELIKEMARETDTRVTLSEDSLLEISATLNELNARIKDLPLVALTYFEKDGEKEGGHYVDYQGNLRRIDEVGKQLIFADKKVIQIEDIFSIEAK